MRRSCNDNDSSCCMQAQIVNLPSINMEKSRLGARATIEHNEPKWTSNLLSAAWKNSSIARNASSVSWWPQGKRNKVFSYAKTTFCKTWWQTEMLRLNPGAGNNPVNTVHTSCLACAQADNHVQLGHKQWNMWNNWPKPWICPMVNDRECLEDIAERKAAFWMDVCVTA